jgi:5-methylcytosine-specific restriction endonuclease McrA
VSCRNCGSDWTTPKGKDCNRCPWCDKQQLFQARKQGRLPAVIQKTCRICGDTFTVKPTSQHAKTCSSRECQAMLAREKVLRHKERKALGLAVTMATRQARKQCKRDGCDASVKNNKHEYCSPSCAGADAREYKRDFMGVPAECRRALALASWFVDDWEQQRPVWVTCEACGKQIEQQSGCPRRFCNNACRARAEGYSHRHRCTRFNVVFDPSVRRRLVLQRDNYVCQICFRRCLDKFLTDATTGSPLPLSPTIDHIVPLSLGIKGHTWDNVQCACFECNVRKGARAHAPARLAAC